MKTFFRAVGWMVGFILFLLPNISIADLTVANYTLVSSKRVTRTDFEYTYRAQMTNGGQAVTNVTAQVTSTSPNTTIIEGILDFGDVAAGATLTSTDTFTIRHNRLYAFSWSNIAWNIQFEPAISHTLSVGPQGGTLLFPNGVILDIPAGAVTQETPIEITDLQCPQVDEIISTQTVSAYRFRCLGGFTGKPDGQVFLLPVMAAFPVSPPASGEIPVQITVDLEKGTFNLAETNLSYLGQEGTIQIEIHGFSSKVAAAMTIDEATDWTVPPPTCCLRDPQPLDCCCTEEMEVVSAESELSYSSAGASCLIKGGEYTVTFPKCDGQPQQTSWTQSIVGDCPEMSCQIDVSPSVVYLFVCKEELLTATVNCVDENNNPVLFENSNLQPLWRIDSPYAASLDPRTGRVTGISEGLAKVEAGWAVPDKYLIPGQAVINVRSNIRSYSVNPAQSVITLGDGIILDAEIVDAQGALLDASTVRWSSSNPNIAFVTPETGGWTSVQGVDCGTVIITASYEYECEKVLTTAAIEVRSPVEYLQVNPLEETMSVGQTLAVEAIALDTEGAMADIDPSLITWDSIDSSIAYVSPIMGLLTLVTANNIGETTITAQYGDQCSQKNGQAQITVNCDLCTFNIMPSEKTLAIGEMAILEAELLDVNGNPVDIPPASVTWTSNSSSVSVTPTGLTTTATASAAMGTATITATYTDLSGQKSVTATITVIPTTKRWHIWSQVGDFDNIKLGADGYGNTFAAWQEADRGYRLEVDVYPDKTYTNIRLGRVGNGEITPIATLEDSYNTKLVNFFVDKMGNMIVGYTTRTIGGIKQWVQRYNVDGGWDKTPALIFQMDWEGSANINKHNYAIDLQIAADSNGNAIVAWIGGIDVASFGYGRPTTWALRYDAGQGWQSQPQKVVQDPPPWWRPSGVDIAMDPDGNAFMVWSMPIPSENRHGIFIKKYWADSGWDDEVRRIASPTNCELQDLVMDLKGNAIVVWYNPDVGIRAKHYDVDTNDWQSFAVHIADIPYSNDYAPSPAISMDESGNALVTYFQHELEQMSRSFMSKGYSIEQGWDDDAFTLLVQDNYQQPGPNLWYSYSDVKATMHGAGDATFVRFFDIKANIWENTELCNPLGPIKTTLDTHMSAREFQVGEGWGAPVTANMQHSDLLRPYYTECFSEGMVVTDLVGKEFDEEYRVPSIIDSHGNATAAMMRVRGRYDSGKWTFYDGKYYWKPLSIAWDTPEVIVMRFQ